MLNVPLLDLQAQYATIRDEIRTAVDRVCDSQHFILGPEVSAFEQEVAAFCGARFALGVSSGTDALLATLMALEVGPGDDVITTTFTFFATAGAIARLGARPVFVDIDPETFNIDPQAIRDKLTPYTKAIIPVHLFGRCAEMAPILEIAQAHGIYLIEDAAQAIGAHDEAGQQAGTLGHFGCFSFFPSKNLGAFGDGGMVITNDETLADTIHMLRAHGSKPKYFHRMVGGNFRLDALQAAVLSVKLRYLPRWTAARRRNADGYRVLFKNLDLPDAVRLPADTPGHIYNQFVVRFPQRDALQAFLKAQGVATEIYYPLPLHMQECFSGLGYCEGDFPHAEAAARDSLALPIYPELTEVQQQHVVKSISAFYQR
jgi:dTDP-4-amino-4,6-dideoxygalactose transaminase